MTVVALAVWLVSEGPAGASVARAADAGHAPDARANTALATSAPAPLPGTGVLTPSELLRERAAAFARFRSPLRAASESVGAYANGCVLGAMALAPSGPNYEVLHLGRHRRYGHPSLIAYVRRLAIAAKKQKLGPLLIGDLSQPRGGPSPYGHRSHQSGLDVDIGFTRPDFMLKRKLTVREREEMQPPVVFDLSSRKFTRAWGPKVERLIELAARDQMVERVFVNPHIKNAICKKRARSRASDATWLRIVRPWAAHHDHLHARLKCPPDSASCESQPPIPPGDGCEEVARWLEEEERRLRTPPPPPVFPPRPPRPPPPLPPLPAACQALIAPVGGDP
ncbi:MAG TPA: penicillin-insensitive murein endopeptidase [Polyangia bacterium]